MVCQGVAAPNSQSSQQFQISAGAELANVANEGAIECGRRGGKVISNLDIYNGIDRILQVTVISDDLFKTSTV